MNIVINIYLTKFGTGDHHNYFGFICARIYQLQNVIALITFDLVHSFFHTMWIKYSQHYCKNIMYNTLLGREKSKKNAVSVILKNNILCR